MSILEHIPQLSPHTYCDILPIDGPLTIFTNKDYACLRLFLSHTSHIIVSTLINHKGVSCLSVIWSNHRPLRKMSVYDAVQAHL